MGENEGNGSQALGIGHQPLRAAELGLQLPLTSLLSHALSTGQCHSPAPCPAPGSCKSASRLSPCSSPDCLPLLEVSGWVPCLLVSGCVWPLARRWDESLVISPPQPSLRRVWWAGFLGPEAPASASGLPCRSLSLLSSLCLSLSLWELLPLPPLPPGL